MINGPERKRGVKRKREIKDEDIPQRLRAKLHHAVKEVKKASKRVRTFETQKIVKKLKDAQKGADDENVKTLESQLECIKHIDCEHIGVQALRSKIKKDRSLWTNSDCQAAVTEELPSVEDDTTDEHAQHAIVKARLLSSKVLAQEINSVVQSLKIVLGLEGKDDMRATSEVSDSQGADMAADRSKKSKKGELGEESGEESSASGEDGVDEIWTGFGEDDDEDGQDSEDESDVDDMDEDRAAEAAGWESGTGDSSNEEEDEDGNEYPSDEDRLSEDEDENSDSDSSVSVSAVDPGPSKKARPAKAKAGESTFLPSLSVGFVKGSDSEWSDAEADTADLTVKKNRRGQRARKAIWEKKYGKNANHLKKRREAETQDAIARSYAGRGRSGGRGGGPGGRGRGGLPSQNSAYSTGNTEGAGRGRGGHSHHPNPHQSNPAQRNARATRSDGQTRTHDASSSSSRPGPKPREEKPLHPSWEAKRRLKEKQSPAILPAQGTRIKFD